MSWIDQRPDDAMDGAFTAVAPGPIATVEPLVFREAMARLGAAVHVVTTAGPAGKSGFYRDRGVFGVRYAGDASGLSQPPQQFGAGAGAKRRVLHQHASRQRREACRSVCRPQRRASARALYPRRMDHAQDRLAGAVPPPWSPSIAAPSKPGRSASHNVVFGAVEAVRLGPAGAGAGLSRPRL